MSVRSDKSSKSAIDISDPMAAISEATNDAALGEGNAYCKLADERTKTLQPPFSNYICAEGPCFNPVCRRREPGQPAEGEWVEFLTRPFHR